MTDRMRILLVANGAVVFMLGLAAGFPFAMEILQSFDLAPLPAIPIDPPGDVRGWRMAHLEGILNGMVLFAAAAIAPVVKFSPRGAAVAYWGFLAAAWTNTVASIIGPLSETRGLAFGGFWNSIVYVLFVIAIVGIFAAFIATLRAALRALAGKQ